MVIGPVVDLAWVRAHRDRIVLADVRYYLDGRSGRDAYHRGHLPGAVFVDLDHDLAAHDLPPAEGRHPLPDPGHFAARMAAAGIGDEDTIVAYDDAGGVMAARLVWMLRATGHEAALLDGGFDAYDGDLEGAYDGDLEGAYDGDLEGAYGGDLETEAPARPPATFTSRPWPADRLAGIDDAVNGDVVLDARPRDRFRGENETLDPRPGHIPGARNVPCRENLTPDGRFLPVEDLRERFAAAGVTPGTPVISYCGSGVTACHNLLAMEHAGLGVGRLYPGSWSAYAHTDRPAATGD